MGTSVGPNSVDVNNGRRNLYPAVPARRAEQLVSLVSSSKFLIVLKRDQPIDVLTQGTVERMCPRSDPTMLP